MAKTSHTVTALQYLSSSTTVTPGAVCAVYGEDVYLKQEVIAELQHQILGEDQDEFSVTSFIGNDADWKDVVDALATVSLFGSGKRVGIVRDATGKPLKANKEQASDESQTRGDEPETASGFISRCREQLERWVEHPAAGSVLILDATTWPNTTRLAKAVAAKGLAIDCRVPEKGHERIAFISHAKKWLIARAHQKHGAPLESTAADLLFDLLPLTLGVIDQEVAKLALYVPNGGKIDAKLVREQVGDWRTRTTWDMIDAMVEGRAAEALRQLHLLMLAGDVPVALFGQIGYTLRNVAATNTLIAQAEARGQRLPIVAALKQAGVKWQWDKMERQLKQIGRERACKLNDWLIEADLALKGYNSSGRRARLELERLIVKLSTAANASRV